MNIERYGIWNSVFHKMEIFLRWVDRSTFWYDTNGSIEKCYIWKLYSFEQAFKVSNQLLADKVPSTSKPKGIVRCGISIVTEFHLFSTIVIYSQPKAIEWKVSIYSSSAWHSASNGSFFNKIPWKKISTFFSAKKFRKKSKLYFWICKYLI